MVAQAAIGLLARLGIAVGRGVMKVAPNAAKKAVASAGKSKAFQSVTNIINNAGGGGGGIGGFGPSGPGGDNDEQPSQEGGGGVKVGRIVKGVAGALGGLGAATVGITKLIHRWSDSLIEGQRELRAYNGAVNQAFAEQERAQAKRNVKRGQMTGASTLALSREQERFKDLAAPFENAFTSLQNNVLTFASDKVNDAMEFLSPIAKYVEDINRKMEGGKENPPPPAYSFLKDLQNLPKVKRPGEKG